MDTPEGGAGLPPPDKGGGPEGPPPRGPEGPLASPCLVVSSGSHSCSAFCVTTLSHPLSRLVFREKVSHLRSHGNQGHKVIYIFARDVQSQTSISEHVAIA